MPNKDHLSNEVNLDVSLSEKGVSGKAKLRSLAAFDRLLGSLMDIPTSLLETVANRVRAKSRQEVSLIDAEGTVTQDILENDNDISRLVAENYIQKQLGLVANKASVVRKSIEHLASADSNDSETGDQASKDARLDDDWLNHFERYAEQASTERMRDLWARVLAGEIRKPQSFSLVTLRFMSELDKDIAALFESATEYRITEGFILKPDDSELVGERLLNLHFLEEVGLLHNVSTGFRLPMKAGADGTYHLRQGKFILRVGIESEIGLSLIRITRIGREIVNVLPPPNDIEVLARVEGQIHSEVTFSQIEEVLKEREDGMTLARPVRILKTKESS